MYFRRVLSAADVKVQQITSALAKTWLIWVDSSCRSSLRIYLKDVNKSYFSVFVFAFANFKVSLCMSFLSSWLALALSPAEYTRASRQNCCTLSRSLAGWPILTILRVGSEACSLSIMLSTAMLDGAQASTFDLCVFTVYKISSTTVVVLPVPGGPWIIPMSWAIRHLPIASF